MILTGNLLKQSRPKGVVIVVSSLNFLARGICQKPAFASNLLKTFASDIWASDSSTLGRGRIS